MRPYIDLHSDTITMLHYPKENLQKNSRMVTIARMQKGGTLAQCFSAFVPTGLYPKPLRGVLPWRRFVRIADRKDALLSLHADALAPVRTLAELQSCRAGARTGVIFTIEDAGVIGKKPERLREAYRRGVRIASLTWNHENTLAYPNAPQADRMQKRLKPFGKEMVEQMQELGMLVDVSHLSDGGFWDVAQLCRGPFVATHSNSRELTPHPRNLTDDMIRALAEKGGVTGLNFAPAFLRAQGKESRICDMVRHVLHIRNVGGSGVLAIGSDFDGISGSLEVGSPSQMELLADALAKAGLTQTELDAMWSGNVCRVLAEVWR